MLVKNKKSGEIENMRHGPATDAVTAGTHTFVNVKEDVTDGQELKDSDLKPEKPKAAKGDDKK